MYKLHYVKYILHRRSRERCTRPRILASRLRPVAEARHLRYDESMNNLIVSVLLFVHFLGLAALIGGLMVQATPNLETGRLLVIAGAAVQLAAGIGLLAILMADANHIKATVKFVVTGGILAVALVTRAKALNRTAWLTMIGLSVANVGIAVFW